MDGPSKNRDFRVKETGNETDELGSEFDGPEYRGGLGLLLTAAIVLAGLGLRCRE